MQSNYDYKTDGETRQYNAVNFIHDDNIYMFTFNDIDQSTFITHYSCGTGLSLVFRGFWEHENS